MAPNFRPSTPLPPDYQASFLGPYGTGNYGGGSRGRYAGASSSLAPPVPPDGQGNCPPDYWPDPFGGVCLPQSPPYIPLPGVPCAPGYYWNEATGLCELTSTKPKAGGPASWMLVAGVGAAAAAAGWLLFRRRGRR